MKIAAVIEGRLFIMAQVLQDLVTLKILPLLRTLNETNIIGGQVEYPQGAIPWIISKPQISVTVGLSLLHSQWRCSILQVLSEGQFEILKTRIPIRIGCEA